MQLCCALGWVVGLCISSAISRIQSPMQPCRGSAGLCVLSYTGRISFFRKPLRPSRREGQEGKGNGKGPANAIGGSSDMIVQCQIAAKLCLRIRSIYSRGKGGGSLVLPVVFPLCKCLTWLSQQGGTELCSLSETLRGAFEEKGGKRWLTRKDQRS